MNLRAILPSTAMAAFVATVSLADDIVIGPAELPAATEGAAYSATLTAQGGEAPYAWSVEALDYVKKSQASTFSATGGAQGWNEDDSSWSLDLPFAFPFAGGAYTTVHVNSNGTLNFDDDDFHGYSYNEDNFLNRPMIAVLWADLSTEDGDIYVQASATSVAISWRCSYLNGDYVNASATLYPDGKIVLSYGDGNSDGGFVGISMGDGVTRYISEDCDSMANADDIVFVPATLPDGLALSSNGVISGTPAEPGEYAFTVSVTDNYGDYAAKPFSLTVAENPAIRPTIASANPAAGYVNMGSLTEQAFTVGTSHPSGGTVSVEWFLDGESVGTGATYAYTREDADLHTIRCVASADHLAKTTTREWSVGTLSVTDPASVAISYGQNATLSVEVVSSLAAKVTWVDNGTGDELGTGETLTLRGVMASLSVKAVAQCALGSVTSAVATVTVNPTPTVGRIFKLTGPSFIGNRLVLRAKTYGDPTGATFAWKRDGVIVATTERLDIPSLAASDFGTYTLTMTNPHGAATTEPFVLEKAKSGVPVGWGASAHGRTTTPEGLSDVAQVAGGMNFNIALKTDGTVAAWGYNEHGGCDVPAGLSGVSFVAAGGYESQGAGFAVKTDGSVVAWGQPAEIDGYWDWGWVDDYDEYGNWIGDHQVDFWYEYTNGWDTVATMPSGLSDVVQVAVGGEFAIALNADGTVVAWGRDDCYDVPDGLEDVVGIAAGGRFALALKADGDVVAWGVDDYDYLDVPGNLADIVSVAAAKGMWSCGAGLAVDAGGTLFKWGDIYGYTGYDSGDATNVRAVDAGQEHIAALLDDGTVAVWSEWNNHGILDIPAAVKNGAIAIAAGGYHCTAVLPDADGDTIPDAEEILLGRDPATYEDYRRATISGKVSVDGRTPPGSVVLAIYDSAGDIRARTAAEADGSYTLSNVVPGRYFLKIQAEDAVDIWLDGARPDYDGATVPFSTFGGNRTGVNFNLAPGQAPALADVMLWDLRLVEDEHGDEDLVRWMDGPGEGTVVYLDMWPTENDGGIIDLGEVAASHGKGLLPHKITLRPASVDMKSVPAPVELDGVEGETVAALFERNPETGSVTIVTEPAGAEIWIDYADQPLGVTPLTIENIAAASHSLLLRKDGYLRPRPIQFSVEADSMAEVSVPLAADTEPSLSVAVDSAIPGIPIYLDYLPTEQATPALVERLDPASHAGSGWFSREHSILLRHSMMSPFAPRAVAEPEDEGPAKLHIDAPNTYEDSDGDGVRNDVEVANGTDPFSKPVTVTFNANGGTGTMAPVKFDVGKRVTLAANAFTRADHVFTGWAYTPNGATVYADRWSGDMRNASGNAPVAGETVALHATWRPTTYLVNFVANGGRGNMAGQKFSVGKSAALKANAFRRPDWVFLGWSRSANGPVAYADKASVRNLAPAGGSATLYAQWAVLKYSAKFNGNGGKLPKKKTMKDLAMTYGTSKKLSGNLFTRKGYVFIGWSTKKNGPVEFPDKASVRNLTAKGGTVTLYAQWAKEKYKVSFDKNGGTLPKGKEMSAQTMTYGKAAKLKANAFKPPKGKKFAGWALSKADANAGKVAYKDKKSVKNLVTNGKTVKFYAVWKK